MVSPCVGTEVEEVTSEGQMLETTPLRQKILRRRGRPRKNKEARENQNQIESCTGLAVEELLIRSIDLEPIKNTSRGRGSRMRSMDASRSNVRDPTQQMEQAQISIVEIYLENRELRWKLAAKTLEVSTSQGCEGNITWLKR